jgi:hypothetical protein
MWPTPTTLGLALMPLLIALMLAAAEQQVFLGLGLLSPTVTDTESVPGSGRSFSFGARWYHGIRRGWFASLNFTDSSWSEFSDHDLNGSASPTNPGRLFTAGAVGGYRFKLKAFFVELGLGALWYRERNTFTCEGVEAPCLRLPEKGPVSHGWFPDAVVGAGFDL